MELSAILTAAQESEKRLRGEFNDSVSSLHFSHDNVIDALKSAMKEGHREDREKLSRSHEEEMQKVMVR